MNKIIDISEYQSGADLEAVYNDGISGFIFRLGYGNNETSQDDKSFEDFVSQAERIGAPWGAYIYSYAISCCDAESEIAHTFRVLAGRKPKLGVWWDLEDSGHKEESGFNDFEQAPLVRGWAKKFIAAMQGSGLRGGLYCNLNYVRNIDFGSIENLWVAGYFTNPDLNNPPYRCDMWQYSSEGHVSGIGGRVDMNAVYAKWIDDVIAGKDDGSIPGGGDGDNDRVVFEGGDIVEMNISKEQLKYEINRHALTLLGREIGDADKYVEFLSEGTIDWYEFDRRLQESEEGVKRWIKYTLYIDILGRVPEQSEINWWYIQYSIRSEMNKALMARRFAEDYEKFRDEYLNMPL